MSRGISRGISLLALVGLASCAATPTVPTRASPAISRACDRYASPSGSNRARGTKSHPVRTPKRLLRRLRRGQTGCFRAGSYTFGSLSVRKPRVTLRSYPGQRAKLRGRLRIEARARGAIVEHVALDGRNPHHWPGPVIYASRAQLRNDAITNHHTGICVLVARYYHHPAPRGVTIEGNRIHDCGRLPATNHEHGIYVVSARGTVIERNRIYGNADRGIQLYPHADDTTITGNVIIGNGEGVIFGGDSRNNMVEGNVIANSTVRYNVSAADATGTGNVVRRNCVWATNGAYAGSPARSGIQSPHTGFSAHSNAVANPRYTGSPAAFPLPPRATRGACR